MKQRGTYEHDDDDRSHNCGSSITLRGIFEDLNERLTGWTGQDVVNVSQAEDEGGSHDKAHDSVGNDGPKQCSWYHVGCVLDFFGYVVQSQQVVREFRLDPEGLHMWTVQS